MHGRWVFSFLRLFRASNWIFPHHDRGLTKFHAGSEQPLVCVVINNSHHPAVKNNHPSHHAFGKYWMPVILASKLSFKILLAASYLLYISTDILTSQFYTNLNVKLSTKLWDQTGGQPKICGGMDMADPGSPFRNATGYAKAILMRRIHRNSAPTTLWLFHFYFCRSTC